MVPRVSTPGASFQGAGMYYLHDKDAFTSGRVAFTQVENVAGVTDAHKALGWMAYSAMGAEQLKRENGGNGAGRKAEKPVWTASFSWDPEQKPTQAHMVAVARSWLETRGLKEHQAVLVGHNDEDYAHVHLIVNLIHPQSGLLNKKALSHSKLGASRWAEAYEKASGKIYCEQRVENNARRDQGAFVRYKEPELDLRGRVTALYHASDSGKAFQAALAEEGFTLAQGKKIVLIDRDGTMHSLTRQVDGVKAKDIRAKLADVVLPDVDEARGRQGREEVGAQEPEAAQRPPAARTVQPVSERAEPEPVIVDRDQQDREWQEALIDAALAHKPAPGRGSSEGRRPSAERINAVQDRQHAELGKFYADSQQARDTLAADLGRQYGDHEKQLRKDIAQREETTQAKGVRRFWLKVTGKLDRETEELDGLRRGLQNIEWRKSEASQTLENRLRQEHEAIRDRHTLERLSVEPQPDDAQRAASPVAELLKQERQAVEQAEITQDRGRKGSGLEF
jgi:hypothetical protein